MERIKIVTDSTCDLPPEMLKEYNITVVPLKVYFGDKEYKDGVDITAEDFYKMLKTSPHHPRTSQPSPYDFVECYKSLKKDADRIISIHISSKLSGTYNSALIAKKMLDIPVDVIDTEGASIMVGFIAREAARASVQGKSRDEIIDIIENLKRKIKIYFSVDTLEYLQKGGRIGRAAAFIGTLLNIKPILTLKEGIITPVEKIRGKERVYLRLIELIKQENIQGPLTIAVMNSNAVDEAEKFKEMLLKEFNIKELIIANLGPVIGTHTGPGVIGVVFYY